jgi:hypothetical protein
MTEKAQAELAKLLAEYDRAVLDRIDDLVSKTPREHRKGLRGELRVINGALIKMGLDPTFRESPGSLERGNLRANGGVYAVACRPARPHRRQPLNGPFRELQFS